MTDDDGTLTIGQALDALRALGSDAVFNPENGDPGPENVPDLLGALAAILDSYTMLHVHREGETRTRWATGYVANIEGRGADALALLLGHAGMRTHLHTTLLGHAAASGVGYARLAALLADITAVATLAASQLTGADHPRVDTEYLRQVHQRLKRGLRETRGALEGIERHLRAEGYQL